MAAHSAVQVLDVHHWNDTLFSFRTTRDQSFRFQNGHFVMIGLQNNDQKPVMRAYSIASANHEDHLEFFSIKVADGALTSRLQRLEPGHQVLISKKAVGTLVIDDLRPGKRLFLLATGTGLAPFLSIIRDLETYERFESVVLVHGVRRVSDLAYKDYIENTLPNDDYLGELVSKQLRYLPLVTREAYSTNGRIPDGLLNGGICDALQIETLNPTHDRAMLCGSAAMLDDTRDALETLGFRPSPQQGVTGDFVVERAFVTK
ncbi:MAG: ferredoxin--NADP reductase [Pseudomonadota bacterium]